VLVYDVVHPLLSLTFAMVESCFDSNIALRNSSTICVNAVLSLLRNVSSYKERG
jgi:hypothetical protein